LSEVELRNDITATMKERAAKRRNRRQRNTRYRPARFNNRRNSIKQGRFSPTMRSKIEGHLREISFVQAILPITRLVLETGTFDPHASKTRRSCGRSGCIKRASTMVLLIQRHMC